MAWVMQDLPDTQFFRLSSRQPVARISESKGRPQGQDSARGRLKNGSGTSVTEGDELDPVWLFSDGIGRLLGQHTAGLVDRIDAHAIGQFSDRGQEAPRWVDGKATWLRLGRHATDRGELS